MILLVYVKFKTPVFLPGIGAVDDVHVSSDVKVRLIYVEDDQTSLEIETPGGITHVEPSNCTFPAGWGTAIAGTKTYRDMPMPTAKYFLDALESYDERGYLFRGVSRADYPLLPSAVRSTSSVFRRRFESALDQVLAEAAHMDRFFRAAYHQGLTIPQFDRVVEFMDRLREYPKETLQTFSWPPPELNQFFAIAQHHGVPTRLLDWTLDPMVAAYFAARSERDPVPLDRIAVWLYNYRFQEPEPLLLHKPNTFPRPIQVPYDLNRNAHAQSGVLVAHTYSSSGPTNLFPLFPTFDTQISEMLVADHGPILQRLTVPADEAHEVMRLLNKRRINGSTMFPGYDGAAIAAKERAIWDH